MGGVESCLKGFESGEVERVVKSNPTSDVSLHSQVDSMPSIFQQTLLTPLPPPVLQTHRTIARSLFDAIPNLEL